MRGRAGRGRLSSAVGLAVALAALAAPVLAGPARAPDYTHDTWRLVHDVEPGAEHAAEEHVWVLERDLKSAARSEMRMRTARVLARVRGSDRWTVTANRYFCGQREMQAMRMDMFQPEGAGAVERGGARVAIEPRSPDAAIYGLVCRGQKSEAPLVRGVAAAFAYQDAGPQPAQRQAHAPAG